VDQVVSRQERNPTFAIACEQFRDEAPNQRFLKEISIDQVKHMLSPDLEIALEADSPRRRNFGWKAGPSNSAKLPGIGDSLAEALR